MVATVAACVVGCQSQSTPGSARSSEFSQTIDLGDGISLAAAPDDAAPRLTADQAWAAYLRRIGATHVEVPASMTLRLGLLNGSGETDRLVWSYEDSTVRGCVYAGPSPLPGHSLPPRPADCNDWTFLDANTGRHVLETQVPVNS